MEEELTKAIKKYYDALIACNQCTELLLACGTDPRAAQIMQEMYTAESEMFALIGIDYHGGKL